MTGLPLDIRHVAFSSAQLGYALAGSGFSPAWGLFCMSALGVALIGLTNLLVSFCAGTCGWPFARASSMGASTSNSCKPSGALFKAEPSAAFSFRPKLAFTPIRWQPAHLADAAPAAPASSDSPQ
jgi:hypothetical protein